MKAKNIKQKRKPQKTPIEQDDGLDLCDECGFEDLKENIAVCVNCGKKLCGANEHGGGCIDLHDECYYKHLQDESLKEEPD
jgi:uncharacterized UBP type Zn finger protein